MKCPYCGSENLAGEDACEQCGEDLASIDIIIEPHSELERTLLNDSIASVPPPAAVRVTPSTDIVVMATKMNEHRIGCVLVMEKDKLVGIVSERDILFKAFRTIDQDLSKLTAATLMTPEPVTLNEDDTLAYALNRMSVGGYRHIPIMKDNAVVGLLSVQNILKHITKHLQSGS